MTSILVDSRDRQPGSTIQNATFLLESPLHHVTAVRVDWIQVYNTYSNLTSSNNQIGVVFGGTTVLRSITQGFYTPTTLVAAVNTELQAVSGGLGLTYNSADQTGTWTGGVVLDLAATTLRHMLGVASTSPTRTFINTSFPQSVALFSPELGGGAGGALRTNRAAVGLNPLTVVPLFAGHNQLNFHQAYHNETKQLLKHTIDRFSIQQLYGGTSEPVQAAIDYQLQLTFF